MPITWAPTWQTISHITGLTLPGMIDEPACNAGSTSSPSPAAGPEAIQRMSLAILISAMASPRSAADISTTESREPWAAKRSGDTARAMP